MSWWSVANAYQWQMSLIQSSAIWFMSSSLINQFQWMIHIQVSKPSAADNGGIQARKVPEKKYGMGKALMTVWCANNCCDGEFPAGPNLLNGKVHCLPTTSSKETIRKVSKEFRHRRNYSVLFSGIEWFSWMFCRFHYWTFMKFLLFTLFFVVQKQWKPKKKLLKKPPRRRKVKLSL